MHRLYSESDFRDALANANFEIVDFKTHKYGKRNQKHKDVFSFSVNMLLSSESS